MKCILYLLPLLFCMCTSSDDTTSQSTFSITVTPSLTTVAIDELFAVTVTSNESVKGMALTTDGSDPVNFSGSDFGTSQTLHFAFDTLGPKNIIIKAKNQNGDVVSKTITILVTRGDCIKITGLQLKSFYNINTPWDPEYTESNINRLADVYFGFIKLQYTNPYDVGISDKLWYVSPVKENQGDLTWDFSAAELYINPGETLNIEFGDKDASSTQLLTPLYPSTKPITFAAYTAAKPSKITYLFPDANLEFVLTIEWP